MANHEEAERMEALGRLAGGVAHDFNNLLTVISGYTQMLQDAIARDLPAEKLLLYVDELLAAGKRATDLTDQLLTFGCRQPVKPQRIDLREQVSATERTVRETVGELIHVTVERSPEPCFIRADPGQIECVILRLAANARDAMALGGRLTMRTKLADNSVLLELCDTGTGIEPELQQRIFEPFFTSKPRGKGMGLGLSVVHGIVKQAGGEIAVESEIGVGTTFRLCFPASNETVQPPVKVARRRAQRGTGTILVVDDEPSVRSLVKAMLERLGYQTIVAEGPKEAVRLFKEAREKKRPIDLLLTDVIMPQMSGKELARVVRRTVPDMKILFMSGYTGDEVPADAVLRKPFTAEALSHRVREAISAVPSRDTSPGT